RRRGLLVRELAPAGERDRGALILREVPEGALEVEAEQRAAPRGRRRGVGRLGVARRLAPPAMVEVDVVGDPVQPRREPRVLAEAGEATIGAQEGLLRQVVGERLLAAREAAQEAAHGALVTSYELAERVAVLEEDHARDQLSVAEVARGDGALATPS